MTYTQSGDPTGNAEIDSKTYESSFFPLSTAEVGGSNFSDGSALSSAAISRIASIQTRYGSGIWTRSPSRVLTGTNSTGFTKYYYANSQYISGASGSSLSTAEGTPGSSYGYLPCFTLPETLYIDKDGFATENQPPEVTSDAGESGVALGEKNEPFTLAYTVTDGDGDPMTITEKVNGVALAVREKVASGTELTVQCLSEKALFQQILNGENTLTLEVDDGKTTTEWTATFTKNVTSAVLSLTAPLDGGRHHYGGRADAGGQFSGRHEPDRGTDQQRLRRQPRVGELHRHPERREPGLYPPRLYQQDRRQGLCVQLQSHRCPGRKRRRRHYHHDRRCHRMSLHKTEKSLKELHQRLKEEQKLRELPGLVAGIEDAMCEQDMASQERLATIEDSLCELDAAINK